MRIFIGSPPVVYKYMWVVAEADFKHIQKIPFGRSLKHCRAGELLWNLELSFWIKCSYLLYLSSQITGSCYWQLGRVIQSILPVSCVWLAQWATSDQNSGAAQLFYKSITQLSRVQNSSLWPSFSHDLLLCPVWITLKSLHGHRCPQSKAFPQHLAFLRHFHNTYW